MIIALLDDGRFVVGIEERNVEMLKAGRPMLIDLRKCGGTDQIMVAYGNTLPELLKELERASGRPLPAPSPPMPTNGSKH